MKQQSTSWDQSAQWYDEYLSEPKIYQKELILPNMLRLLGLKPHEIVLDAGCGQGFFAREFAKSDAHVVGVDSSERLIQIARSYSSRHPNLNLKSKPIPPSSPDSIRGSKNIKQKGKDLDSFDFLDSRSQSGMTSNNIEYHVASADSMPFIKDETIDKIVSILALQNMDNLKNVFQESSRILKPTGQMFFVLNHPAFRIPRKTSWEWDEENQIQYRRIDQYLSESKVRVQMHPGSAPSEVTYSFHRSIQLYFKLLANSGFAVTRLEEWTSHRTSEQGPRKRAEDLARKEFPLFLFLEARKVSS